MVVRIGRRTAVVVLAALFSTAAGSSARAQDVSVRAYLSNDVVGLNQAFVLSVEISGSQQVDADPALPDMEEYAHYLSSSTSQQMQIVNNRMSVTFTLQYRFQAIKEGSYTIPPIEVTVGGEIYSTDPLALEITATPPPGQPAAPGGRTPTARGSEVAPEDLFLEATANKSTVYLGQPVIVAYDIYTRVDVSGYEVTRQPSTAGFWTEEYPLPRSPAVRNTIREGRQYATATIRKLALFPTSVGTKTIDPMSIEAQVRVRRASDPFADFFRGGGLFGTTVPTLIASNPVTVEVLPLPESGRPADFSGFVGNVSVTAGLDKTTADVNEALTFTVRVEGDGNIRTLPEFDIGFPSDFEVYPPETSEQVTRGETRVSGSKTYEYVLIPRAPGTKSIPSVRLSYFDPGAAAYRTDVTAPITVEITGEAAGAPVIASRARGEIMTLREDIRFIHIATPAFRPAGRSLLERAGFWIVLVLPMAVVGGALGVKRHRQRIEGDIAYARRRRANRAARRRLARARRLASPDTQREFYAEVGAALQGFLGDKLNIAEAGMIRDEVGERLRKKGLSPEVIEAYFGCLDVCDRQRFAPSEASDSAMNDLLARAEAAMADLDRGLSK